MKKLLKNTVAVILAMIYGYVLISWFSFQVRNPICNGTAFYIHFMDVMTWKILPEYQTK